MMACKQEAEAEKLLSQSGLETFFIAKYAAVRTSRGVCRRILRPCLPRIVFVRANRAQIADFRRDHNSFHCVTCRRPAGVECLVLPDSLMADFIRISHSGDETVRYCRPEEIDAGKGVRVRVSGGAFVGLEGVSVPVPRKHCRRVAVVIPDVLAVSIEIESDLLELLP